MTMLDKCSLGSSKKPIPLAQLLRVGSLLDGLRSVLARHTHTFAVFLRCRAQVLLDDGRAAVLARVDDGLVVRGHLADSLSSAYFSISVWRFMVSVFLAPHPPSFRTRTRPSASNSKTRTVLGSALNCRCSGVSFSFQI